MTKRFTAGPDHRPRMNWELAIKTPLSEDANSPGESIQTLVRDAHFGRFDEYATWRQDCLPVPTPIQPLPQRHQEAMNQSDNRDRTNQIRLDVVCDVRDR